MEPTAHRVKNKKRRAEREPLCSAQLRQAIELAQVSARTWPRPFAALLGSTRGRHLSLPPPQMPQVKSGHVSVLVNTEIENVSNALGEKIALSVFESNGLAC